MACEDVLEINGRRYVAEKSPTPGTLKIVVFPRGWVVVGNVEYVYDDDSPSSIRLTNASVIRLWGTTKGLGEIALGGPTSKTVLDPCGTVTAPVSSIILIIDCEESKWTRKNSK